MPPIFIMLAHDARGRCWYYCSRGWAFPTVLHYILLLCDRWQQRNRSKSMSLKSSMWEKWHLLTFPDTCWTFKETKQWMWAQRGSAQCVSAVATAVWKTNHISDGHADFCNHGMQGFVHQDCTSVLLLSLKSCWTFREELWDKAWYRQLCVCTHLCDSHSCSQLC